MDINWRVHNMSDFNFVGAAYETASIYQDAQVCLNWYPEIDALKQQGERGVMALYPTPGLTLAVTLDNPAMVRGMHPLPGGTNSVVVSGNVVYTLSASMVAARIGYLTTSTGVVSITDNGTYVYMADGTNRYYWPIAGGAITIVSDGAFNGANLVDEVDNFIIYNSPNSNQWGCTNVGSIVSSGLNFAATLTSPGNIVGLISNRREVFLISEYTCEVWVDVGSYPFPFQCVPGSSIQHGCAARGSIAQLGESFAFLAQDKRGIATIVMMNGYNAQRISTFPIENAIQNYAITSDAVAYTYQEAGHEFYVITFPSADVTWAYDLSTNMWHRRSWVDNMNVQHRVRANCMMNFANNVMVGDWQNGNIYIQDTKQYTDNGHKIVRQRRCPHLTADLKRMFHSDLQIQFQPGVGLQSGQGQNPQAMLRWSDDGGSTWSNEHWVSIGQVGQYKNRALWRRLGHARDRIYEVNVSDPINAVIVSANLNALAGAN
jgi:hypothetical protein